MTFRDLISDALTTLAQKIRTPATSKASTVVPSAGIYLYFDEAGDLDFRSTGSRYYLSGILLLPDPWELTRALNNTREELFRGSFVNAKFHASEDLQSTRTKVFECIRTCGGFEYHVVVIEKSTIPLPFQEESLFYTTMADLALRSALALYPSTEPIYLITDRLPVQRKRQAVIKGFKNCLAGIAGNRKYDIGHHSSEAHPCLQAADYVNWAVFRKWERGDIRSYDLIRDFIRQEIKLDGSILRS